MCAVLAVNKLPAVMPLPAPHDWITTTNLAVSGGSRLPNGSVTLPVANQGHSGQQWYGIK